MILSGKVALVTGGARGIGRASAIALAAAGADVAVNDLRVDADLESAVEEIRKLGRRGEHFAGDVSDPAFLERTVGEIASSFGRLDIAVGSAVYSDRQLFHEADLAGFRRTVDVTMWGAFYLLREATKQMVHQGQGGAIVMISSPHAFIAVPRAMAYNMSKAAVDQMVKTAAVELTPHRIRVNMIHPGWVDTPGERKFATEDQLAQGGARLPWGRMARPEEIARGVVFMCDPASEYITGSSLLIDGASTLPWWASRGSGVPE